LNLPLPRLNLLLLKLRSVMPTLKPLLSKLVSAGIKLRL
jgi:hypothetical protein